MTHEDGDVLDLAVLADRLAPLGIGDVRPLAGGASSLTYTGVRDGERVVVKVAPPGVEPVRHRDVLRQARLLRALSTSSVPLPKVLHEDAGAPVDVPPLFVMSFLEGSSLEPLFDLEGDGTDADVVSDRLRDAARVLAQLHAVNPADAGLADEPVVTATEEVERWSATLRTVDAALVPRWESVAERLRASAPRPMPPAIVHGDFRLGNLLAVERHITAVIDWEIWSVSDPRVDLGWFLLNADADTYGRATPYVGCTPSGSELVATYAGERGQGVPVGLSWFVALAAFKSAATWALIVKHNRRREEPDPALEAVAADVPRLLQRAEQLLS
ncbi:MAG TPA: phosphotransferase family protein [Mycobacteriales bacterium]|nr:phosphotransferase family protein [Mycobacteriales bacterium]